MADIAATSDPPAVRPSDRPTLRPCLKSDGFERDRQIDGSLLEDSGAYALDDVLATAVFDDDRVDAVAMQQVCKEQPCGTGADDADLCPGSRH